MSLLSILQRFDFWMASLLGSLLISGMYYWVLLRTLSIRQFLVNNSMNLPYQYTVTVLVLLVIVLFGLNFGIWIYSWRSRLSVLNSGKTLLGAVVGSFGLACPICGSLLFSLLGISAGLAIFPFGGLELWGLAIIFMLIAIYNSVKYLKLNCSTNKCGRIPDRSIKFNTAMLLLSLVVGFPLVSKIYNIELKPMWNNIPIYPQCSVLL